MQTRFDIGRAGRGRGKDVGRVDVAVHILVTGGSGFVGGQVLAELVRQGHEVTAADVADPSPLAETVASDVTFVTCDVTDSAAVIRTVEAAAPDRIVHLVSLLGRACRANPGEAMRVNVVGTANILDAAADHAVERVVTASSVSAYGTVPSDIDHLDESVPQEPDTMYGLTKYAIGRLGAHYRRDRNLSVAALEPVHGIGPGRDRGNIEDAVIVKAAIAGLDLSVPNVDRPYELIHVADTARAFVRAAIADGLSYDRYLVGTGETVTLADVAARVRDHVPDVKLTLLEPEGEGFPVHPPTDTARIRSNLGWSPRYGPMEAVDAYIDWLNRNPEKWSIEVDEVPWATDEPDF